MGLWEGPARGHHQDQSHLLRCAQVCPGAGEKEAVSMGGGTGEGATAPLAPVCKGTGSWANLKGTSRTAAWRTRQARLIIERVTWVPPANWLGGLEAPGFPY